jgi:anthranilate phosphoribosyltransferase
MLEQLGVNLNLSIEQQCIVLEKCGFVFMFAQNHHPCMKYIMPIRKSISHRTIFNILGPLVNPAGVKKQLIGVFDKKYIMKMAQALKKLGSKKVMVVSSKDNMDEISICDITYGAVLENGEINEFEIDPRTFGFDLACLDDIKGGDVKENAQIALDLLDGKTQGAKLNIILLNCAFALYIDEKVSKVEDGIKMAYDAIKNGKARQKLDEIIKITNSF